MIHSMTDDTQNKPGRYTVKPVVLEAADLILEPTISSKPEPVVLRAANIEMTLTPPTIVKPDEDDEEKPE